MQTTKIDTPTVAPPKTTALAVYKTMGARGYEVGESTVRGYEAPEYSSLRTGAGVLPAWFTDELGFAIRSGEILPFTLADGEIAGHFGNPTGAANVTTLKPRKDMTVAEVVAYMDETGQLDMAKARLAPLTDHENVDEVVAFALATYLKGPAVETLLDDELEGFSKGSLSHDTGGIDGYLNGDPVQVKSVTWYASRNTEKLAANDTAYLWYQWDCDGGLHVGTDANAVNGQAANVKGVSKTLIKRSAGNLKAVKESDRKNVRYMWW